MTTAKPQHSSGQADSADDLIAELARMMAENAQGDRPASFTTAQLPPASTPPSAPQQAAGSRPVPAIRIPGGEIVPVAPAQAAPTVAVPPAPPAPSRSVVPPPTPTAAASPAASPLKPYTSQLREPAPRLEPLLGARPAAAPTPVPRPAPYVPPPAPRPVEAPAFKVHTFTSADAEDDTPADRQPEGRSDFDFELDLDEIAPATPAPAASPRTFDFDFGFGDGQQPARPVVVPPVAAQPDPDPTTVAELVQAFDDEKRRDEADQKTQDDESDEAIASGLMDEVDDQPAGNDTFDQEASADGDYDAAPIADEPHIDPIAALISAELGAQPSPVSVAPVQPMSARVVSMPVAPPVTPANSSFSSSRATPPQFAPSVMPRPASSTAGFPQPAQRLSPIGSRPTPVAVPRQTENDSFAVSPVFGLGAPAAKQPAPVRTERDPMDEIESLIGDAVRVDMANPSPAREPRLTSPIPAIQVSFAPRRTTPVAPPADVGRVAQTAEDAIMAAAAASGGEISAFSPEDDAPEPRSNKKSRLPKLPKMPKMGLARPEKQFDDERRGAFAGARPFIGLGVAVLFLLAAGYGLYTVFGMNGGGDPATAPVLAADVSPVKEVPDPVVASTAAPQSVVFNELAGAPAADPIEQLISRDDTANTDVARVVGEQAEADAGLANRKVRTVTVRPDGTIISGDDQVAGGEILPVARPDVPALPAASVDASDLLAGATAQPLANTPSLTPSAAVAAVASAEATGLTPAPATGTPLMSYTTPDGQFVPVPMPRLVNRSNTPSQIVATAPVVPAQLTSSQIVEISSGAPRPVTAAVDQPVDLLATTSAPPIPRADVPQAQPQQAALTPAPVATGGGSSAYVQLSSQRSESVARAAAAEIQQRYGQFFGGAQLEIQRADLGERGIYYRVRLPAGSAQQAASICANIRAQGGDSACFIP